jgi:hypothetical protein
MLLSFLIGFSDFWFFPRSWVFISTIQSLLIAQSSEPSSISGIMVAQTGFMNTRTLLMKRRLIGGLFGARIVFLTLTLLSYRYLVLMRFRFSTRSFHILLGILFRKEFMFSDAWDLQFVIQDLMDIGIRHLLGIQDLGAFGNPMIAKNKEFPMNVLHHRAHFSVSNSGLNGGVHGRGRRGRAVLENSNLIRPRNLHWWPILSKGFVGPGSGPSSSSRLGSTDVGPSAFLCHFCKVKGHMELFCRFKKQSFGFPLNLFPSFESRTNSAGKLKFLYYSSWFRSPAAPLPGGPPMIGCFEEFAWVVLLKKSEQTPLASLELSLGVTSPKPQTAASSPVCWRSSAPPTMAYRQVDPKPFLPPGFSAMVVQHREIMSRSVSRRLPPMHEDWAILNIQPLPDHAVLFPAVRDVVREYLVEHRRLGVRDIQRSHLGQVLVQFYSVLERDNLVLLGPQQYLDATFTALRHNDA